MYRRELEGRVLSFGHAGILYENSFVMYDRGTGSLWVHVTGEARHGPLKGKRLTFMPSTVTTWENWKSAHPGTLVLPGHRRGGLMGTYTGILGARDIGLAVVVRFKAKLYPFRGLHRQPLVNDSFGKTSLLVYYSEKEGTAIAWNRSSGSANGKLPGRVLTFRITEERNSRGHQLLADAETGSRWNWLTGEALSGPLKGKKLAPLLYNPILVGRYHAHYPDGAVWRP